MSVPSADPDSTVGAWESVASIAVVEALADHGVDVTDCALREFHLDGGDDLRLGFDVTIAGPGPTACTEVVWAARFDGGPPPGTHAVPTHRGVIGVWRYPFDPALPGLPEAVTAGSLSRLLGDLADSALVEAVSLDPMRRAVVRVGGPDAHVYVRVLPPHRVADIEAFHHRCTEAGLPVPAVLRSSHDLGLLVTGAVPGRPLPVHLADGGRPPTTAEVWHLVRALGDLDPGAGVPTVPLTDDLPRWTARLVTVDPGSASRVRDLARDLADVKLQPLPATIHGDLHPGQLLVDGDGHLCGIVDLDEAGMGDLLDDLGRLVANATMGTLSAQWPPACDPATRWLEELGELVDGHQLRHRSAMALLGRATGAWQIRQAEGITTLRRALTAAERLAAN